MNESMETRDIIVTGICGALYAVVGYLIYIFLPITAPGIGIVRFWPSVVIPATFAVLFGPMVGGLGAAMGQSWALVVAPVYSLVIRSVKFVTRRRDTLNNSPWSYLYNAEKKIGKE